MLSGWTSHSLLYGGIMFIAGIGIPTMAALNAGFGVRIGNPVFATCVLCLLALSITTFLLFVTPDPLPSRATLAATPPQFFMGGLLVAFYILTITWIAPKIGIGNAIFIVLLGQLCAAAVIDHYGLFGSPKYPLTTMRMIGLGVMAAGVFLARRPVGE